MRVGAFVLRMGGRAAFAEPGFRPLHRIELALTHLDAELRGCGEHLRTCLRAELRPLCHPRQGGANVGGVVDGEVPLRPRDRLAAGVLLAARLDDDLVLKFEIAGIGNRDDGVIDAVSADVSCARCPRARIASEPAVAGLAAKLTAATSP